jgi:hypothetical protein
MDGTLPGAWLPNYAQLQRITPERRTNSRLRKCAEATTQMGGELVASEASTASTCAFGVPA